MNQFILKRFLILLLFSFLIFFLGNNLLHLTDPDEVFYSLSAKEMIQHNDWTTPYIFDQPQFEKPIMTYWFLKVAFSLWGINPFSARFFPALFASLGILAIYALGLLGFKNERKAFLSAIVLGTSAFYVGMGKTVFTDTIFTVFMLYSLLGFYLAYSNPSRKILGILCFYVFAGFAVLTKGPLGLLIPEMIVVLFLLYRRQISFLYTPWFSIGLLASLVVAAPWYWLMVTKYGHAFIQEFFYNDHYRRLIEAEHLHNDHWYFYPMVILGGMFPWSFFLLASFIDIYKRIKFSLKPFQYLILSWILIVFLVFQVAHSKLASYILPMYPALALLTADFIEDRLEEYNHDILKRMTYGFISFLVLLGIAIVAAHKVYKPYVPSLLPAYWLSGSLFTLAGIAFVLLLKDKIYQSILLLSTSVIIIFAAAFMIVSYIEPFTSVYEICSYIPEALSHKTTILVSKPLARGVRYYTDENVAVYDMNGENYFSPHPIPILNTNDKLLDFLKTQPETYAVLRKTNYQDIVNLKQLNVELIKKVGNYYLLKIKT